MSNASILLSELKPLLDAASEKGIDLRGLSDGVDGRIPIADYFRIQRDIAVASDDLTAVLSKRKLTFKTGHFLVAQMQRVQCARRSGGPRRLGHVHAAARGARRRARRCG